jgi:hypothetical protein
MKKRRLDRSSLFHYNEHIDNAQRIYKMIERNDIPCGSTYDSNGKILTYKNSNGYWEEFTYDSNGNELTFKDSYGYWYENTYDSNVNLLTFKDIKYDK